VLASLGHFPLQYYPDFLQYSQNIMRSVSFLQAVFVIHLLNAIKGT
jgi:hypothetical protein